MGILGADKFAMGRSTKGRKIHICCAQRGYYPYFIITPGFLMFALAAPAYRVAHIGIV